MSSNSSLPSTSAGPSLLWRFFRKSDPLETNDNSSENTLVSPIPALQNIPNPVPIPTPPPAVHSIDRSSQTIYNNAFDIFFGARPNQAAPRAPSPTSTVLDLPPGYTPYDHQTLRTIETGSYTTDQEPPTLARFLFLYGFSESSSIENESWNFNHLYHLPVFFPFWILGLFVLLSPLRPTPDWEDGKTEYEREQLLVIIRNTEKKWGRRCLYAFSALSIIVILIAIIIRFTVGKSP